VQIILHDFARVLARVSGIGKNYLTKFTVKYCLRTHSLPMISFYSSIMVSFTMMSKSLLFRHQFSFEKVCNFFKQFISRK